jgi:hypothetical protein
MPKRQSETVCKLTGCPGSRKVFQDDAAGLDLSFSRQPVFIRA